MGIFRYHIEIAASPAGPFEEVEALVDTGASYTLLPRPLLQQLGVEPTERQPFTLADGRGVEYDLGEVRVRIDGRSRFTVCIFGEAGAEPLLGSYTLEGFGLTVDPLNESLKPAPGYLVAMEGRSLRGVHHGRSRT